MAVVAFNALDAAKTVVTVKLATCTEVVSYTIWTRLLNEDSSKGC